jgi:tetrahydromethanopterin S-methyltransferase subunit A
MQHKIKVEEESINNYRGILRKVDKMKCEDFVRLKEQVHADKPEDSKSLSEAILIFANRG